MRTTLGLRNGDTVGHVDTVPLDMQEFAQNLRRALVGEEGRVVVRAGARTLDVWYGPWRDASGAVTGVVGLATEVNGALRGTVELEAELRAALDHHQLRLHTQPVVRCDNGRVALMEALVRWQHPDRGVLLPEEFLPVADEAGLLGAIDRWVLGEASRQVAGIAPAHACPPVVAVNMAGLPFADADIVTWILDEIGAAGLMPQQLIIEVTEGLLGAEEGGVVHAFERLRAHGVRIAVDDFGTGYSSLNRLKSLPVDLLKVDRAFVEDLGEQAEASALLDAIVTMGHALGMQIIAEGVETATQLAEVRRLGCDMAQGHYFARPAPLSDLHLGEHRT
jgi:EAL domain-containing protein (putative c-di-GMP-specific phosphodiesterase class I)